MKNFNFFIGEWNLEYNIPNSSFSERLAGKGIGTFKRVLNDKYVIFNYEALFSNGEKGAAYGIFAWDEKINMYRYWWFEDTGSFDSATCNFIDDDILFMSWQNSNLFQTFKKIDENTIELRMLNPKEGDEFELILGVLFKRK